MEEVNNKELIRTNRKTTSNIKNNQIMISNSNNKYNLLSDNDFDFNNMLNDYEELNGINFTDKFFKRKVTSRKSFISKIPIPDKKCIINVGRKYPNFESKLLF